MNTIIAGATGGLVAAFFKPWALNTYTETSYFDIGSICNGILTGLVSITGACDNVEPWAAFIIGAVAGVMYIFGVFMLKNFRIDDPLEAAVVHGFGGLTGLLAVGCLDNDKGAFFKDVEGKRRFFTV